MLEQRRRNDCGMDTKLNPKRTVVKKNRKSTNSCGLLSTASTSKMCKKQSFVESVQVEELLKPFPLLEVGKNMRAKV